MLKNKNKELAKPKYPSITEFSGIGTTLHSVHYKRGRKTPNKNS